MQTSLARIYLADDDPGHSRLIVKNLRRSGLCNEIEVFADCVQLLERLREEAESSQPALLLLDLNMPGMSGHRVLKELKGDEKTRHIPIIVLTTSDNPDEISECYKLGCNLFLTKPIEYTSFSKHVRQLGQIFQIIKAPQQSLPT